MRRAAIPCRQGATDTKILGDCIPYVSNVRYSGFRLFNSPVDYLVTIPFNPVALMVTVPSVSRGVPRCTPLPYIWCVTLECLYSLRAFGSWLPPRRVSNAEIAPLVENQITKTRFDPSYSQSVAEFQRQLDDATDDNLRLQLLHALSQRPSDTGPF